MSRLHIVDDLDQWWGQDISLSPTGDLARTDRERRSKQRVLRRLLTNPGDYIFHRSYGAGLPADIGTIADNAKIRAKVRGQMRREASVQQAPEPSVALQPIINGLSVRIAYTVAPERIPAVLSFDVTP